MASKPDDSRQTGDTASDMLTPEQVEEIERKCSPGLAACGHTIEGWVEIRGEDTLALIRTLRAAWASKMRLISSLQWAMTELVEAANGPYHPDCEEVDVHVWKVLEDER